MESFAVPVLEMKQVSKQFPGVRALSSVDFRLLPGEVHALMGQNGAGKSTLVKVLAGAHPPDGGRILLDGREIRPASPLEAQRLGISAVFQEVNLCTNLSVAENLFLGHGGSSAVALRWREMRRRAAALLSDLNIHIDVTAPLSTFSLAVQQMVAIARSLSARARILILDEPTSSLAEDEVKMLFSVIRRLRGQGMAILFITHFLDQLFEICDRVTVLRNGQRVGEHLVAELSRMQLVTEMVGREVAEDGPTRAERGQTASPAGGDAPLLRARGLGKKGSVQGVDLDVRPGEALGLAGLLGAGKTETARLLFGIDGADHGVIEIDGEPAHLGSPLEAIARGLGFCSEDRKTEGILGDLSLRENIVLALQAKRGVFRNLPRARQDEIARGYIQRLGIVAADAEVPISKLSGGNQQKALLARWLATDPRMLILDEPTRGIDVAAKAEIMGQVMELCDRGMAVVLVSSEMAEALRYSDRIVVMRDRRKAAELAASEADERAVYQVIAGGQA
ncbi:sugar ABC transporter ATP-binding protein [Sorangium sp. So ce1036]|uniref:sugar ABC transporter ATP-binding protein n=1 Tax=Sorangium sp. So ce1036 TaxID=3133328 RepID=UPI003F1043E3